MEMKFFHQDHVKIEQFDSDNSIITIQCPSCFAADLLVLIDTLSASLRWTATQCRVTRISFTNAKRAS